MTWTADKPTAPGYYWHRYDANPTTAVIRVTPHGRIDLMGVDDFEYVESYVWPPGSLWAGPIQPPEATP